MSGQRLPKDSSIVFTDLTIEALATSLVELRVGGNGVRSLSALGLNNFMHLELLDCRDNALRDLEDIQLYFSRSGQSLRSVTFRGNPVEKSKDYFRGKFRAKREITLIARGMKLTRLCSHAPVAALLPARVGQASFLRRARTWSSSTARRSRRSSG